MNFLDFIIILPEIVFLNQVMLLFWVGLYLRHKLVKERHSDSFNYFSIFILVLLLVFFVNAPIKSAVFLDGSFSVSSFELLIKSITTLLMIAFLFTMLETENSLTSNLWNIEICTIRLLLVFALFLLANVNDLVYFWIVFEVYSLSTYVLIAYKNLEARIISSEIAIKYFILGTIFGILLLYGVGLIYFSTGLTNFDKLAVYFSLSGNTAFIWNDVDLSQAAVICILISIFFKLAAAPFHFWAPDVYEGCSTSSMYFLFVVPKLILFGVLSKLSFLWANSSTWVVLLVCGVISLTMGALGGLFSARIKRLVVYSTIANTGYFLLALMSSSYYSFMFLFLFLIIYCFTLIGLFNLIQSIKFQTSHHGIRNIWSLSNLFFTSKTKAISLFLILFSAAGIPPLVGFIIKFLILFSLMGTTLSSQALIVVALGLTSFSCFYYIRIIKNMVFSKKKKYIFIKPFTAVSAYTTSVVVFSLFIFFITSGTLINFLIVTLL